MFKPIVGAILAVLIVFLITPWLFLAIDHFFAFVGPFILKYYEFVRGFRPDA
jgi:hypothetical protein